MMTQNSPQNSSVMKNEFVSPPRQLFDTTRFDSQSAEELPDVEGMSAARNGMASSTTAPPAAKSFDRKICHCFCEDVVKFFLS